MSRFTELGLVCTCLNLETLSFIFVVEVVGALVPGILDLVVEAASPEAKDDHAVDVEHRRQFDQAVGLVRHTVHEDEFVGEAQVHDKRRSPHNQIRRDERLDQEDENY